MKELAEHDYWVTVPGLKTVTQVAEQLDPMFTEELEMAAPMNALDILKWSTVNSTMCRAGFCSQDNGLPPLPVCLFGVVADVTRAGRGIPWYVGTIHENKASKIITTYAHDYLAMMASSGPFTAFENHVYAKNKRSIRFLRWLGFTLEEPAPWGAYGKDFVRFWMEA